VTRIGAYGISATIPDRWEARIFRHAAGEPTLHAATFPLPASDGEFGTHATERMPAGGLFLSLTEYRGDGIDMSAGGLFGGPPPRALEPEQLSSRALMQARPGQRGAQRFFSVSGRAFCLYVVASDGSPQHAFAAASELLRTLEISPAGT
jgi:hypothetical protein